MAYDLRFVTELKDPEDYRSLLVDYFDGIVERLSAVGGPDLSPVQLAEQTVEHVEETLPPRGGLVFVADENGRLVGTGCFRRVGSDAAEFKRMYVRPEAQRKGLGRKIFQARLSEARRMGCRRILADTVKGNTPMLSLYEHFGFQHVERYPENFNPPELDPFLVYLELKLDES